MPDKKEELLLKLSAEASNFSSGLRQGEKSLDGFMSYAKRARNVVDEATRSIGILGTAATALSTGLVLKKLLSVNDFIPIDNSIRRLQSNLKLSTEESHKFLTSLARTASETGQALAELSQSAYKISFTYNPDEIKNIVSAAARAAQALGEPFSDVFDNIIKTMKLYHLPSSAAGRVSQQYVAARLNSDTYGMLLERGTLKGGSKSYEEALATLSGVQRAGYSSNRTILPIVSVISALKDPAIMKWAQLSQYKINPETGEKTAKSNVELAKDFLAKIEEVTNKFPASMRAEEQKKLLERVDQQFKTPLAHEALGIIAKSEQQIIAAQRDMENAGIVTADRVAAANDTWVNSLDKIKQHLEGIKADQKWLFDLTKEPVKWLAKSPATTKAAGYTAILASAGILATLGFGKIKSYLSGLGRTVPGIAEGLVLQKATGIAPVFVTNWPTGSGPGGGGGAGYFGAGWGKKPPTPTTIAASSGLGIAGLLKWAGPFAAMTAATLWLTGKGSPTGEDIRLSKVTAPEVKGDVWSEMFERAMKREEDALKSISASKPDVNNKITLNVRIENDRVFAETTSMNTELEANLMREAF